MFTIVTSYSKTGDYTNNDKFFKDYKEALYWLNDLVKDKDIYQLGLYLVDEIANIF